MKTFVSVALASLAGASFLPPQAQAFDDVRATNCEIFIDRIAARQTTWHGAFGGILIGEAYVKIDLPQVGLGSRVFFYGRTLSIDKSKKVTSDTGFRKVELIPFQGSSDYFMLPLGHLSHYWFNDYDRISHEGAFFVEKANGTRLWLNSDQGDGHFFFDEGTSRAIRDLGATYVNSEFPYGEARHTGIVSIPNTASTNTYLNPQRCQL